MGLEYHSDHYSLTFWMGVHANCWLRWCHAGQGCPALRRHRKAADRAALASKQALQMTAAALDMAFLGISEL
jgi:hypothetical protein